MLFFPFSFLILWQVSCSRHAGCSLSFVQFAILAYALISVSEGFELSNMSPLIAKLLADACSFFTSIVDFFSLLLEFI